LHKVSGVASEHKAVSAQKTAIDHQSHRDRPAIAADEFDIHDVSVAHIGECAVVIEPLNE
jgi:hypothetical protein